MYPTIYSHCSHDKLLTLSLQHKNVILFISDDDIRHGLSTLHKLLAHIQTASNFLVIYADDIPLDWLHEMPNQVFKMNAPTEDQFLQINDFLQQHANQELIASCSAGTSRSGFVHFYLDILNHRIQNVVYYRQANVYGNQGDFLDENIYRANSLLTHFAINHMTSTQKQILKQIRQK